MKFVHLEIVVIFDVSIHNTAGSEFVKMLRLLDVDFT